MRPKGQIFDLKAFRLQHNLSQKEIAEAVKRPQSFLSAIEHGKRSAPPGFLDDLCRLYKVDNISDYIHDREEPNFGEVSNVHNSIVNSPGGSVLLNDFKDKLSVHEIQRILEIEEEHRPQVESTEPVIQTPPPVAENSSTIADLVRMLSEATARYNQAEARIKELEKQVENLQAQLPKRKK